MIDLSLDMRRRAALQRTMDESRVFQDTLNTLVDGIRGGPSGRLDALFSYIRAGATAEDIANVVHCQWSNADDQDLDQAMISGGEMDEPPTDGIDRFKSLRDQTDPSITHEEMDHQETEVFSPASAISDSRTSRDGEGSSAVARLVAALKSSNLADGEELVRQFLSSRFDERTLSFPGSASSGVSSSDGALQHMLRPSMVERSHWHPALQARSESRRAEQQASVSNANSLRGVYVVDCMSL